MEKNFLFQKGIGLIEIIIAIAILSLAFFSIFQTSIFYLRAMGKIEKELKGGYLTQEAVEAVRSFRKEKTWSGPNGVNSLTAGANYFPQYTAGEWLMISGEETIDGIYTRRAVLDRVSRDANDDIESVFNPANEDINTRKITAETSWDSGAKKVDLVTYITNIEGN